MLPQMLKRQGRPTLVWTILARTCATLPLFSGLQVCRKACLCRAPASRHRRFDTSMHYLQMSAVLCISSYYCIGTMLRHSAHVASAQAQPQGLALTVVICASRIYQCRRPSSAVDILCGLQPAVAAGCALCTGGRGGRLAVEPRQRSEHAAVSAPGRTAVCRCTPSSLSTHLYHAGRLRLDFVAARDRSRTSNVAALPCCA